MACQQHRPFSPRGPSLLSSFPLSYLYYHRHHLPSSHHPFSFLRSPSWSYLWFRMQFCQGPWKLSGCLRLHQPQGISEHVSCSLTIGWSRSPPLEPKSSAPTSIGRTSDTMSPSPDSNKESVGTQCRLWNTQQASSRGKSKWNRSRAKSWLPASSVLRALCLSSCWFWLQIGLTTSRAWAS